MKILLSNKFFYPRGGDCIHTIQLKQLLESKGHKVAVFSMNYPQNIENEYSNYWPSTIDFSSIKLDSIKKTLIRPLGAKEVKMKWVQLLNDFRPDVVHLHNIHSQLSPIIAKEAKKNSIPVVWTLHDFKLICPAHSMTDNEGNVCEDCLKDAKSVIRKKCIKGSLFGSTLGYLEAIVWSKKKLGDYTSKFISPSKFLKNKMIQGGYSKGQIEHVYNFVDDEKFEYNVKTKRENQVVFVGRLSEGKGVETLCKSFQNKQGAVLKIFGDGPLRLYLEKKYASSTICFLGFRSWEVIEEELAKAKFMIMPSEWYENNPLTIIESLALGTPVLGAKNSGIFELINNHVNGLTFTLGNKDLLSKRIDEMLSIEDWNYSSIQRSARLKFSQDVYYKNLMKIYSSFSTTQLKK